MNDLLITSDIVKNILCYDIKARQDDDYLYCKVLDHIDPAYCRMNFRSVMESRSKIGLPAYESVRRVRQKLQSQYDEFKANSTVRIARYDLEAKYKSYALKESLL